MLSDFDWSTFVATTLGFVRDNAFGLVLSLAIIYAVYRVVVHLANRYLSDPPARLAVIKWSGYIALWFSGLWVLIVYGIHRQKDVFFLVGIFLAATAFSLRVSVVRHLPYRPALAHRRPGRLAPAARKELDYVVSCVKNQYRPVPGSEPDMPVGTDGGRECGCSDGAGRG